MSPESSVSFALIFAVIGAFGTIYTVVTNIRKQSKDDANGIVKANAKLDQLCTMMTETRVDIKSMESKIDELAKKQIEHELRLQTVEKKVDEL